jgi:hypothetical protein
VRYCTCASVLVLPRLRDYTCLVCASVPVLARVLYSLVYVLTRLRGRTRGDYHMLPPVVPWRVQFFLLRMTCERVTALTEQAQGSYSPESWALS